jgi:hypothetical protein
VSIALTSSPLTTLELARRRCSVDVMEAILEEEVERGHVERAGDGWRATRKLVCRFDIVRHVEP